MGRPINKKYFGNKNLGTAGAGDNFIGGEGISLVVVTNTATNTGFSTSTAVTWVASAPQLPTGVAASGTAVVWFDGGQGRLQSLTVTEPGSGYTSTSSITISYTPARTGGGTAATTQAALLATQQNAIQPTAYIGTGSSAVVGDIIKQVSTKKYLVKTAQGIGQCKLSTTTLGAGDMWILATDVNGSTYYVTKLTAHKAYLTRKTMVGSYEYATGAVAKWNLATAAAGNVKITNG